jgi:hypothetical protein
VYLLVSRAPKAAWEPSTTYVNDADGSFRWIAVYLTRKARDAHDFGYKDMDEAVGPVEARCPRRLIAAASPLRNSDPAVEWNYAARWHQKCLNQASVKARRKAELVPGASIRLSRILDFADGYKGDCFMVEIIKQRHRNHTYFRARNGRLYRISNIEMIGYRVEPAAEKPSVAVAIKEQSTKTGSLNEFGHYKGQKVEVRTRTGERQFVGTVAHVEKNGEVIVVDENGNRRVIDNALRVVDYAEANPGNPTSSLDRLELHGTRPAFRMLIIRAP